MLSVHKVFIHLGYFCVISWIGCKLVSCSCGVVCVYPQLEREGLMLPDELINSESKQIQVSTASLKPQRRVEFKIAVYNKLPIDLFFYF